MRSRSTVAVLIALAAVGTVLVSASPAVAAPVVRQAAPVGEAATALLPLPPCRLFDARRTPDRERIDASTWRLSVVGRCGVPASARSVAVSMVATGTPAPGFVTVSPGGAPRPEVSNLNYERGNTVANSAVVKLGSSGSIDVYTSAPADIIIDVTGVFLEAPAAVSAGRFVAADPTRVVDTRTSARRGDGEIRVPLPAGVPRDAVALAVSVTAVDAATDGGYLSVYPAGGRRSETSVVNTDERNRTRANAVFVAVGADGFVVFRSMEADVLVDVWGWFTGASAPASTDGLFVPQDPTRVWDSRFSFDPVHRGGTVERDLSLAAAAIVANVTVVEPTGAGFVSVFAAGTPRPDVSSLNYRWRQPVAALTVSRLSDRGVALHSFAGAHLLVDVAGWFTGAAVAATTPPPVNAFPPGDSQVLFVSDSSFAGIRWNGALPVLAGAAFDSRLESCRRLIGASCRGREGYAPRTAEVELSTAAFGRYDTAVVAVGYNDSAFTFSAGTRRRHRDGASAGHRPSDVDDVPGERRLRLAGGRVQQRVVRGDEPVAAFGGGVGATPGTDRRRLACLLLRSAGLDDHRWSPLHGGGRARRCRVRVTQAGSDRAPAVSGDDRWAVDTGWLVRRSRRDRSAGELVPRPTTFARSHGDRKPAVGGALAGQVARDYGAPGKD